MSLSSFATILKLTRKINGKEQRVIVAGDADYASNLRLSTGPFNGSFLMPGYSWLVYNRFPIHTPGKKAEDTLLKIGTKAATIQKTIFVYVLPVVILLAGDYPADPQKKENNKKMYLQTDEQTIGDLGIFGNQSGNGIYDIYNHAHTRGGEKLLEEMFRAPLSDKTAINNRSAIIARMMANGLQFPFDVSHFDVAEKYLSKAASNDGRQRNEVQLSEREIQNGVLSVISLLHLTKELIEKKEVTGIAEYETERQAIAQLLSHPAFEPALKENPKGNKLPTLLSLAFDAFVPHQCKIESGKIAGTPVLPGCVYFCSKYCSQQEIRFSKSFR